MKTLLIPYIIWNIATIFIMLFKRLPCFSSLVPDLHKGQLDFSLSAIFVTFWDASKGIFANVIPEITSAIYPQNAPLWFVRDLMIVVLCTPILYWLLRHTRYFFVLVLGIFWCVLDFWNLGHTSQLITAFFFFTWGAYMSIN